MTDYYDRDLQPMDDYSSSKTKWGGRRVLQTNAGGYRVSTVWITLDHSCGDGGPIVFETLIWDGEGDGDELFSTRHGSEEEAARWHLQALDAIRAGKTPDYSDDRWMETTPVSTTDPTPYTPTDEDMERVIYAQALVTPDGWARYLAARDARRDEENR